MLRSTLNMLMATCFSRRTCNMSNRAYALEDMSPVLGFRTRSHQQPIHNMFISHSRYRDVGTIKSTNQQINQINQGEKVLYFARPQWDCDWLGRDFQPVVLVSRYFWILYPWPFQHHRINWAGLRLVWDRGHYMWPHPFGTYIKPIRRVSGDDGFNGQIMRVRWL